MVDNVEVFDMGGLEERLGRIESKLDKIAELHLDTKLLEKEQSVVSAQVMNLTEGWEDIKTEVHDLKLEVGLMKDKQNLILKVVGIGGLLVVSVLTGVNIFL